MTQFITYTKVPSFQLQVTYTYNQKSTTESLLVQSFQLKKQINNMTSCRITIASGSTVLQSFKDSEGKSVNKSYSNGVTLFKSTLTAGKNIPCTLWAIHQYSEQQKKKKQVIFKGYVITASPGIITQMINTRATLQIDCIGSQFILMTQPGDQYVQIPQSQADTNQNIEKAIRGKYKQDLAGAVLTIKNMIDKSLIKPEEDDIVTMLHKFDCKLRSSSTFDDKGNIQIKEPSIRLVNHLQSNYKLGDRLLQFLGKQPANPTINMYINDLCQDYQKGVIQRSLWQGLVSTLCTDKFLQLIPPTIDDLNAGKDKYKVIPTIPTDNTQQYVLPIGDLASIYLAADYRTQVTIPDYLILSVDYTAFFDAIPKDQSKKQATPDLRTYGTYPKLQDVENSASTQKLKDTKVRVVTAPNWLASSCCLPDDLLQKIRTAQADTNKKSQLSTLNQKALAQRDLIKSICDEYAKILYFYMYSKNKNAQISIPYTQNNLYIDGLLGKPVKLLARKMDNQLSGFRDWNLLDNLLGVVYSVQYRYTSASGIEQNQSSITINVGLNMITQADSQFGNVLTQGKNLLYKKKA